MPDIIIAPQDGDYPTNGVNPQLLSEELLTIGVHVATGPHGIILHLINPADETAARAVVAAHDATQKSQTELNAEVAASAKTATQAIPNWAGWTETQVLDWMTTNMASELSSTPNTETAIRSMARLLVALRNQVWPDLQE